MTGVDCSFPSLRRGHDNAPLCHVRSTSLITIASRLRCSVLVFAPTTICYPPLPAYALCPLVLIVAAPSGDGRIKVNALGQSVALCSSRRAACVWSFSPPPLPSLCPSLWQHRLPLTAAVCSSSAQSTRSIRSSTFRPLAAADLAPSPCSPGRQTSPAHCTTLTRTPHATAPRLPRNRSDTGPAPSDSAIWA